MITDNPQWIVDAAARISKHIENSIFPEKDYIDTEFQVRMDAMKAMMRNAMADMIRAEYEIYHLEKKLET
jgi:hypothetical protein